MRSSARERNVAASTIFHGLRENAVSFLLWELKRTLRSSTPQLFHHLQSEEPRGAASQAL